MTTDHVPLDDPEVLHHILATTDALLLDFDGPVCAIFANLPAQHVADQLREVLAGGGHRELPAEVEKTEDPFEILTYAATLSSKDARYIESALQAHEVEAAATAPPTPGAHDLIKAWHATGRRLAIVSNNSRAAVNTYLHRHDLMPLVLTVSARTQSDFELLKPNPYLVRQAATILKSPPWKCTLIGDSVTDIEAAQAAQTHTIGYANKTSKVSSLTTAGSDVVVTNMANVLRAI
ncbi:HAD-IA family hydrolase [Saccharothrix sp.]|uniref:HAD family hydrolase n=1 Tax=Saccharothrix sp. TaxID=1873460 RepID=UPI002812631B|nr:HAD-IA family hydrolase [Saccharothrix sp.]